MVPLRTNCVIVAPLLGLDQHKPNRSRIGARPLIGAQLVFSSRKMRPIALVFNHDSPLEHQDRAVAMEAPAIHRRYLIGPQFSFDSIREIAGDVRDTNAEAERKA